MSLEVEREQVVQHLCALYAQDHLTTGELERRFERVYAAKDPTTLRTVLEGLPAVPRHLAPAPTPLYEPPRAVSGLRDSEKRYAAVFAEVRKEGVWRAPSLARVRAIFGTVVLDLREADIPPDGMLIDAETTLGEIKIILPIGVGCEVDCTAVLGEVKDRTQQGTPGLPFVRVRGGATLGTITVQTKLPKKEKLEGWRDSVRGWLGGGSQ